MPAVSNTADYSRLPARCTREVRAWDQPGWLRALAGAEGFVMVRQRGGKPFVMTEQGVAGAAVGRPRAAAQPPRSEGRQALIRGPSSGRNEAELAWWRAVGDTTF